MTREEIENALHCLKAMINEEVCEECNLYGTTGTDHCETDCVRVAIEAMQKHIPRKMVYESDGYAEGYPVWDVASCPGCGRLFDEEDDDWQTARFCPFCGQALDWEMEALQNVPDVNVGEMEVEDDEEYND